MSKSNIRKITVDPTKCNTDPRRPSVFERLGTKPATTTGQNTSDYCRNWALNGSCSYGKNCKYANTHTLISPSKRVKKDNASANAATLNEDPFKRLTSKIVKKTSHSPDLNLEEWNQTDLEYEDEKVLERRRQLLQRELELQMKKDKEVHGKDKTKHKKKAMSSSSSSRSSSTSSSSSSSSSDDSSSSSTSDSRKKVKKVKSKRHHSASSDYDEDKERKKKLKLKRLSGKPEKLIAKKKRKIEVPSKKDTISKTSSKKIALPVSRKHTSTARAKSPPPPPSHASSSKAKERNRSESPKSKVREFEKEKHYKKVRDADETSSKDVAKGKTSEKVKELEKGKSRAIEERSKGDDRSKQRPKEKERRSRTPPLDRSKHQHTKESTTLKSKRSRTPEKSTRSKRDPTPPRHQDKPSVSSRSREVDKKDRDPYKKERSKDRDDSRRNDQSKSRLSSNQDDNHRKNAGRDFDDKNYASDRSRQRSKERRDKDYGVRDERSHSRVSRDQRDSLREKEREEAQERCRERHRERDRDKDSSKVREREIPPLMATAAINPMEKSSRYGRDKERFKDGGLDKTGIRDRRSDRERERTETKPVERERGSQRFDSRYDRPPVEKEVSTHKSVDRDRAERFPRERSLDRIVDKNVPPPPREHLLEREAFERDRQRRFNARFDRTHASEHERKDQSHIPPLKIDRLSDRRDSPRLSIEMDRNFERGYARLPPPEHWEEQEESAPHLDYRDHHTHDENRRKPVEPRRYNSPFEERRGRDDRPQSRYAVQNERQFDELRHPLYAGEKLRTGAIRDESSNENWDLHHELEHGNRDRAAYAQTEWEEREWRARHAMWERESLPRSEAHDEEWAPRYESPMPDWKHNEARKWDNQPLHVRGPFRNDRVKDVDVADALHNKRRPFNTPELRDECSTHGSKQGSLHGSMKEEPINKKLMELAEGRPRRSREKSADSFQKRMLPREKSEPKEPPAPEPKRPCLDESLQTLHTESDLSDISDDPDDILNMEEEIAEANKSQSPKKTPETTEKDSQPVQNHDTPQPSLSDAVEEKTFTKEKETTESLELRNLEDENMETMDFEEISDGELEEDIKTSGKGLGDALGVDWESLVKESQPRRSISNQDTAQGRWQCKAIFQRIGISVKYAGPELLQKLTKKYGGDDSDSEKLLLDDIALIHTALVRKKFVEGLTKDSLTNDDLLYRYNNEEDENEDVELLEPCTSLYEEAKLLLQQAA